MQWRLRGLQFYLRGRLGRNALWWYVSPRRDNQDKSMKQFIFAVLLAAAFGFFAYTIQRYVRVMMRGRKDPRPRFDQLDKRLEMILVYFLGQKKVAEAQIKPAKRSTHHLFIFWGFLIITVGTVELIVKGLFPSFHLSMLMGGTLYSGLRFLIDIFNLIVLAMVAYAFYRRVFVK